MKFKPRRYVFKCIQVYKVKCKVYKVNLRSPAFNKCRLTCISDFGQPCSLNRAGRRIKILFIKRMKIWLLGGGST